MAASGAFTGQVVTVVGAGAGLGRQYCLDLAAEGAQVVVAGPSASVDAVTEEIKRADGDATVCRADARDGKAIIDATLKAYGRIDSLIVNAGILRDRSFSKMTEAEWSEVFDVHLNGSYACMRAVWPVMMDQRKGRIVLTSTSGSLYGNFGQANYIAAKGAVNGLALTLALEGKSRGIAVNVIAPVALTRLTEDIFTDEVKAALPVEGVSPFVLALAHPSCTETGAIIEAGGGWAAKYRLERSGGRRFEGRDLNLTNVLAHWDDIVRFDERADHPTGPIDTMTACVGPGLAKRLLTHGS